MVRNEKEFDDLIRPPEQRRRDRQAEGSRSVDDDLIVLS